MDSPQPNQQPSHDNDGSIHIRPEAYDAFTKISPDADGAVGTISNVEPTLLSALVKYLGFLVLILLFFVALLQWGLRTYQVDGTSMLTTYEDGDRLIINAFGRTISSITGSTFIPKRGEIITFISPENPDEQFVKRVIGLPDERVVLRGGVVTVYNDANPDGFNPDEAYLDQLKHPLTGDAETFVPADHIFVAGDNRSPGGSYDSRTGLGTVPLELIQGSALFRFYPL